VAKAGQEAGTLPPVYDPGATEAKLYEFWENGGLFRAEVNPDKEPFSIVMPPPNVTGSLHIGHALNNTLQDALTRWRRMQGREALWLPGTDHAGIATQHVVEKALHAEGLTRHDLGREGFIERVWEWKHKYGGEISKQFRRLGVSCDWSRERFTLDEGCSRAVRTVFVRLYEKGLIYKGDYLINWCSECGTALSDLEVEHEDVAGRLYYIRYPLEGGDGEVVVATTRPETMLGDTAVAVHPDDERYAGIVGRHAVLPIVGRRLPVIADAAVDPEFGTGAVKVTPAHDPDDFELGLRHDLGRVSIIDENAKMSGDLEGDAAKYRGMDRYECREALVADLHRGGYLVKEEDYTHAVGRCYRCDSVVEPLISTQWFVKMKPLAAPAIEAVKDGRVRFRPERFTKVYLNWMEQVRDWCISRQLWWGHRIPAWECADCGRTSVSMDDLEECPECGSRELSRDPDVLDTWFSSGLWPFETLGWPDDTPELRYFFPTSVLVTGYDIIFFWVARMVFMSLEFTGKVPFREVFINGLVRLAEGEKMSKSRGTGIDPLGMIEEYGADALRMGLVMGNPSGRDIRFSPDDVQAARNFANKLWNAARFVIMNLEGAAGLGKLPPEGCLTFADRWILSRYNALVKEVTGAMEGFEPGDAAQRMYDFFWREFCDWYIEMAKPRLYGKIDAATADAARQVLYYVMEGFCRLLHPFMPFVTEAVWQALPHDGASIVRADWPEADEDRVQPDIDRRMAVLTETVRAIRNLRAEVGVHPSKRSKAVVHAAGDVGGLLREQLPYAAELAGTDPLQIESKDSQRPRRALASVISGGTEVYLPLEGLVDADREIERLEGALAELRVDLERSESKLGNRGFLAKAPSQVVERERRRHQELEERIDAIERRLAVLRE